MRVRSDSSSLTVTFAVRCFSRVGICMMLPFNDRCYHDNKSARNQMNSIAKKMLIYSILSFSQQKKRFLIKVLDSGLRRITSHLPACWLSGLARSLSDLKEIYCKFAWTAHISPLSWSIVRNQQNLPSPSQIFATILQVRQTPRSFINDE